MKSRCSSSDLHPRPSWSLSFLSQALPRLLPLFALFAALNARAASPDLSGSWRTLFFELPGAIYFQGNTLVGGDDFSISVDTVEYTATTFQNRTVVEEKGPYEISTNLLVTHHLDDGQVVAMANLSGDIMIEAEGFLGEADSIFSGFSFALRSPASLAVADLAGQWNYRYFETGQNATAPNRTPGAALKWSGLAAEELTGFSINSSGVVSHPALGGVIGALRTERGSLIYQEAGGEGEAFYANASKDVLAHVSSESSDDGEWNIFNIVIMVRAPESLALSDIVGRWHITELRGPESLFIGGQPGNLTVPNGNSFEDGKFSVTFLPDGRAIFVDPDTSELAEFQWSIQPGGLLRIASGSGEFFVAINRSKNFGAATYHTDDGEAQINLAVKYSHEPILPQLPEPVSVDLVAVEKHILHVQTSASATQLQARQEGNPSYGGPYGMSVTVEGPDLGSIAAPKLSVPAGSGIVAAHPQWFNGGTLTYRFEESAWGLGPVGDNWGAMSQAEINQLFPDGIYTVNLLGESISLNLAGNAFPPAPLAQLSGGEWINGIYMFDAAQPFTITLPVFAAFTQFVDGRVAIEFDDEAFPNAERMRSESASTMPLSRTFPARAFSPGTTIAFDLAYNTVVDKAQALGDALVAAVYSSYTRVTVMAKPSLPALALERAGSVWRIVWSGGILENAPSVNGPWSALADASSPQPITGASAQGFYRVRAAP